jgi:sigma-B regulation protein RsbU (phosphoserine phosphatase)
MIAETMPNVATESEPAASRRIRVLLVEDNPTDAKLIEYMLREADRDGFELRRVELLQDGLRELGCGDVDLVLSDLSLPDSNGLDTFLRLRSRAPHVPIIVLSGLNDATVALTAVHEGAQDYLVKGEVNGQLLAHAIRYSIERKRMTEQLHRYAAELREKNAQLESDFNMAREIQQIFLPNQYPTFPHSVAPEDSALKFFHRYISAQAVGGDFFDIFAITDSTAGVLICDVMGHGMRAALITAIMRGLIEELMPVAADAGKFVTEINRSLRAILRQTREPFLATAFYAVADADAGELRFANAGHPSPFRLQYETREVHPLKIYDQRHGPALGLFEKTDYPTSHCPLAAGDRLFLYTDGIYEAVNPQGEEFGKERLLQAVRRRIELPSERLFGELLAEVRKFARRDEFEDDVCLVGVEAAKIGSRS